MSDQSSGSYVQTRQLGDARVSIISDGSGLSTIIQQLMVPEAAWRAAVPEANAAGEVVLGYNVAHVALGGASILIDLGFDDPSAESQWREPRHQRSPGIEAGLASLGVRPEAITHVLITHAHGDHFAGGTVERDGQRVPRFPNARHYIGRRDWEGNPARENPSNLINRHLAPIDQAGLLELVDGEREIVPGVTMIAAPGESPGHSIVRVHSGGQTFYFVGDLFHHPCEVENLDWVSAGRDPVAFRSSRDRFLAEAVPANATIVFTHRPFPPWGTIVRAGNGYRWQNR